jgi:anaphase-promoting complex subunit 1
MASVKSLGLHPPLGIEGQPIEGKLTWDVITDEDGEDELLTVGNCVIWKRGGLFRKSFNLDIEKDEPILQALLTRFPTNDADHDGSFSNHKNMGHAGYKGQAGRKSGVGGKVERSKDEPQLAKALVVFLKTQAHIYFLSGTSHIVHMPFEVESACAAPVGVVIQRKPKTQNLAPVSLKFPRVPPSSFVSSYMSPSRRYDQSATTSFSVEGLGQPKALPLRLNATMENMFETPLETSDSHWPRLVSLTDPLLELGLVVSHSPASGPANFRSSSTKSPFLDLAEEILHIETVRGKFTLAVTANREANLYTVWQLAYIKNEDIFTKHQKRRKSKPGRRRSSMQPRISSGATTPILPSFRESLNAQPQQPAKKNRKSERLEKAKQDDIALALGEENEGDKIRRQSRRVSSLLARADLSASHERTTFAEQTIPSSHAEGRRMTGARARQSGGTGPLNLSTTHSINNLGHLLEAPTPEDLLDELGGFHDMGLDDHNFDGLTREILLTKIHSMPMDNSNVRYSLSNKPARAQSKVFIVDGPPFATDERGNRDLLICIQDKLDKRLQLLPLRIECQYKKPEISTRDGARAVGDLVISKITPDVLRRAHNVVDSCKVSDGDHAMILILSENAAGQRELSIQAPWSAMSTLALPMLYADNLGSLEYVGTHVNKEAKGRRSVGAKLSATDVTKIRHSRKAGVIDLEDHSGNTHRVQIQLQPRNPQVRNVLQVCQSVLPVEFSEKLLAGWWQIVKWVEDQNVDPADVEWSSLVIEILGLFLSLSPDLSLPSTRSTPRRRRSLDPTAGPWEKMNTFTAPNASACPPWMGSHAWRWMLETETSNLSSTQPLPSHEDFLTSHIRLAKLFMSSTPGQAAFGTAGYLPTASSQSPEDRCRAAWGIAYGLHLLLEEQKLDIMIPEYSSLGRANLRVLLCQICSWLGWHEFTALHQLGVQAEISPNNHHGICTAVFKHFAYANMSTQTCRIWAYHNHHNQLESMTGSNHNWPATGALCFQRSPTSTASSLSGTSAGRMRTTGGLQLCHAP